MRKWFLAPFGVDVDLVIIYVSRMGRPLRASEGGLIYHALNRSNARQPIFQEPADYDAFLRVLSTAVVRHEMRLLAFCVMPTHFHLLLWPTADGDLSRFMRWLTLTHTQRWHAHHKSAGTGHVYQGRFKSFPIQDDGHFHVACRYVERNALKAGLVDRAEAWRWGSLASRNARAGLDPADFPILTPWPIPRPRDWVKRVNTPITPAEEEAMQKSISRNQPFGAPDWQATTTRRLGLESTFKPRGRPRLEA